MKYMTSGTDLFGDRHTLWYVGDYHYQIECRVTGNKIDLPDMCFEDALRAFESVLVSY
jgi:hypothetical protein